MPSITGFVIIEADGKLKKPRHSAPSVFPTKGAAQSVARKDGDSVVPVEIDLGRNPVFIRSKKL